MTEVIDYKPTTWSEGPYPFVHKKGWWIQASPVVAIDCLGLNWFWTGKEWKAPTMSVDLDDLVKP